jgi:hypothetical protein
VSDFVYSWTLAVGLVVAMAVAAWSLFALLRGKGRRVPSFVWWSGGAAAFAASISSLVHLHFGHGDESPEPMSPAVFIMHHPAYVVVTAALVCAGVCGLVISRRPRG